jgi:hypothetical protein
LEEAVAVVASAVRLRSAGQSHEYAALMDAPLFGLFVFAHGRWSDFATTLEQSHIQEELFGWSGDTPFFPVRSGKAFLRAPLAQLTEVADVVMTPKLVGGAELFAVGARLAHLEKKVEQLTSAMAGAKSQQPGTDEEGSRREGSNPRHAEKSEVKPAVVDTSVIASCVQSFAVTKSPIWDLISKQYPSVSLFAIDADPRTFQVSEKGKFDGRANLLVSMPRTLRSGRVSTYSMTIPARVFGKLSPAGEIEVSEFKIS